MSGDDTTIITKQVSADDKTPQATGYGMWYWKLAIFKFINGCLMVGEGSFLASVASSHLFSTHGKEVIAIIIGTSLAMQKATEMFIDQTIHRLATAKETQQIADAGPSLDVKITPAPPAPPIVSVKPIPPTL